MIFEKPTQSHRTIETVVLTGICSGLFKENLHLISVTFLLILITGMIHPTFAQQNKIDSLVTILNTTQIDTNRVNILYKLADIFTDTKPDKAIQYANQGFSLSKKLDFQKGQSICLNALGLAYYQIGKLDTAMICFDKRLEIVSKTKDSMGIAGTYDNMGIISFNFGKIERAIELRTKANKIYSSLNERSLLASGNIWLGNIYKEKGDYTSALDFYIKALKVYEEENDENNIGYPLLNISSIYRYMKQY